ncbi:butyrophilin subfamily 3 member A2-like [Carassius auratus]|uniref:Butyrophilin subfamily 3 member A2-like n=1 Tax=Carassius auratus TaxID=7957 RepID=A0A6P6MG59_CARAU|nr:butyrophilin subfamily 3 member A2-like [Carassius auratus]
MSGVSDIKPDKTLNDVCSGNSEQYEVVGPADTVFALPGEDVILPCSVKPSISVVDMRVEWFRSDLKDSVVHLYEDHDDRNAEQTESYRGRTKLNHEELQRGDASLKLSSFQISDEGRYKCFIQSKSWYDDATVDVSVEAVGRPPVITVDGFDDTGGLHLQCESEGWNPEPVLEWLNSEGVSLSSETAETSRNTDGFRVKHSITVHHSVGKIHCRVKLRHHILETLIIASNKRFNPWTTSIFLISAVVLLIVNAGMLIAGVFTKVREATLAPLKKVGMGILNYIDNWLIVPQSWELHGCNSSQLAPATVQVYLIAQTLCKIGEEEEQILKFVPCWPNWTWFPELMLIASTPP